MLNARLQTSNKKKMLQPKVTLNHWQVGPWLKPLVENVKWLVINRVQESQRKFYQWSSVIRHSFSGFSLIEMLVVMSVFSILAIVATQTLTLSIRGSRKSDSISETRENVQYALNVMDRLLKNARRLSCTTYNIPTARVDYIDEYDKLVYFSCEGAPDSYIASNSAASRLTSPNVVISNCSQVFICHKGVGVPDSVDVSINATTKNSGIDGASVPLSTKILLRNY